MRLAAVILLFITISCNQKKDITDKEEFAKEVFTSLQNKQKDVLLAYLVSKSDIAELLKSDRNFSQLKPPEQKETIESMYNRQRTDVGWMIDFYIDKNQKDTKIIESGNYKNATYQEIPENGVLFNWVTVKFVSGGNNYNLNFKAVNVKSYWKLIAWIEVKESL